jgi:hypothetical protein
MRPGRRHISSSDLVLFIVGREYDKSTPEADAGEPEVSRNKIFTIIRDTGRQ